MIEDAYRLGDTHHVADDLDAARQAWQHALTILDDLASPDASLVEAKLHQHVERSGM